MIEKMIEKKQIYEAEVFALPPLRAVLGDVPSPDPIIRRKPVANPSMSNRELREIVIRLIHHLEKNV